MPITPSNTELSSVPEGVSFSQSVTYSTDEGTALIYSVVSSVNDPSINIAISGNTVTISGSYTTVFLGKTFEYLVEGQTDLVVSSYNQIPEKIQSLIKYRPVLALSSTVVYTININVGSEASPVLETATITQVVTNTWDAGKAQMLNVLSRGQF